MSIRTDIAAELPEETEGKSRIISAERGKAFRITEIILEDDSYEKEFGRKKGRYITMECDALSALSSRCRELTEEFAEEISDFIRDSGSVLVVGLGNDDITPDALGPLAASGVMATRHLKNVLDDEYSAGELRDVSVFVSGVLGATGIESAETVRAVADMIKPDMIIVIDALACSDLSRLGKTIQISDAGIAPGSGVENRRKELSSETMGIPVIAVGVPTIVDMHTLIEGMTGKAADKSLPNMMVTPKDIDSIVSGAAELIAAGLNLALQPSFVCDDIMI